MKFVQPQKPHFFKYLLSGFNNGIRIPTTFSEYIQATDGSSPKEALLKMNAKEWRVKVTDDHFTGHGWRRFAEETGMQKGDFVVFEHQGSMVFNALIFDPITHQHRENEVLSDWEDEEEVPDVDGNFFIFTIKPYNINWYYLRIPAAFARSSGLAKRNCKISVEDDRGKSWCMDLKTSEKGDTRIRHGSKLNEFFSAKGFKLGDSLKLELVSAGKGDEIPVVRITSHMETIGKRKRIS